MYRNYSISPAPLHGPLDIFRSRMGGGSRVLVEMVGVGLGARAGRWNRGPFERMRGVYNKNTS